MPRNLNSGQRMGPLSVGNVVSGGLRLYRDRFQQYYTLAFIGYLWVIVPVYGWAKYAAMHGLIARLAFREVIERPETVDEARSHVNPRMWNFLVVGLLVFLIFLGVWVGGSLVSGIVLAIFGTIVGENLAASIVLAIVLGLLLIGLYFWIFTRLSIVELPIAIEDLGATDSIGRSWNLTEGLVGRLIGVYLVAIVISLPIGLAIQFAIFMIQFLFSALFPMDSPVTRLLYLVLSLALGFAGGAVLIPFWQAIKAVLFYDLCSRREGLGLNLGDSTGL